ncbi:DUF5420 family protein [Desulfovibrio falkowii]|uniref:DUF5420 family protein n=1 Tax=Desulfovibrio sp. WGS1351 TaxID=3366814 RepID=UPI00372D0A17
MSEEKHYYIGEGPASQALISDVKVKHSEAHTAREALRKKYNADNVLTSGWEGRCTGLFFKEKQVAPHLKGETRVEDGYGYYPKKNCKAGKLLAEELSSPSLTFQVSDYIISHLKLSRMVILGRRMLRSVAGYADDKLLVVIPRGFATESRACDPMPEIPSWLREVKESEFLAAQGK